MKYNKGFAPVIVLLIVLGVLAVGGGAYFVGKSSAPKSDVSDNSNYFPTTEQNYTPPVTSNTNSNTTLPVNTPTNNSTPQTDTSNWKTYTNSQYGFSFKYPVSIKEIKSGIGISSDLGIEVKVNNPQFIFNININPAGTGYAGWSNYHSLEEIVVDNIKAKISYLKNDESENSYLIRSTLQKESLYIDFYTRIDGSDLEKKEEIFKEILSTFKFIKSDSVSTSQPTKKVICTLSGNNVDDNQEQNYFLFVAQGQSCATASGFAPNNNSTSQTLTFNGVTKTWRMVLLSFYMTHFSPDGKHFAYSASNLPLPPVVAGGDWKPKRFIVSDNVAGPTYDDVYFPQYSQDGKHLGYCARQNGQYLKIVDGAQTITTQDDYFATCDSLFGFKQGPDTKQEYISPDGKINIKVPVCGRTTCSPVTVVYNQTGVLKTYDVGGNPAVYTAFSADSKHFVWLVGNKLYIDANIDVYSNNQNYNEVFNVSFSGDSKSITYNARSGKTVYFVTEPIN